MVSEVSECFRGDLLIPEGIHRTSSAPTALATHCRFSKASKDQRASTTNAYRAHLCKVDPELSWKAHWKPTVLSTSIHDRNWYSIGAECVRRTHLIADNTGVYRCVFWGTDVMQYFSVLKVGYLVAIDKYRIKDAYQNEGAMEIAMDIHKSQISILTGNHVGAAILLLNPHSRIISRMGSA